MTFIWGTDIYECVQLSAELSCGCIRGLLGLGGGTCSTERRSSCCSLDVYECKETGLNLKVSELPAWARHLAPKRLNGDQWMEAWSCTGQVLWTAHDCAAGQRKHTWGERRWLPKSEGLYHQIFLGKNELFRGCEMMEEPSYCI